MIGTKNNPYDIIISGAGPSGLTAGIVSGRYRLKTLIIEKEESSIHFPRGETLHNAKIFSEILGSNVLNMLAIHLTASRKFNSPNAKKSFELFRKRPSIVFKWKNFMKLLVSRAEETKVEFKYNTEVLKPILEENICIGVELTNGKNIYAKTVMTCDGYSSNIGRKMNIPYEKINLPIVKRIITNFKGDYKGFEYFFITPQLLDYAPRFPPGIIFIFPRGNDECEVGLMLFINEGLQLKDECDIPDEEEIMRVWHKLIVSYPKFSDLMNKTKCEFEGITKISVGNLYDNPMPKKGLMIIGGATGFVEASGASGIASSMQMAKIAVDFIFNNNINTWTKKQRKKYVKKQQNSKIYKHIKNTYRKYNFGMKLVFVKMKTAEKINRNWSIIQKFL